MGRVWVALLCCSFLLRGRAQSLCEISLCNLFVAVLLLRGGENGRGRAAAAAAAAQVWGVEDDREKDFHRPVITVKPDRVWFPPGLRGQWGW